MRHVAREELTDYQTYTEGRAAFRAEVMAAKDLRRVHVGEHLTFLFENALTVRYQVQEMMRIEEIVREADILHELQTYNELLGKDGELGATLLIEIDSPEERAVKLVEWLDMPRHLYARLPSGELVRPRFDERQVGDTRLSSVQYLVFDTDGAVPVALGCDLDAYRVEAPLSEATRQALADDLAE